MADQIAFLGTGRLGAGFVEAALSRGDRVVYIVSWNRTGGSGGFTVTNPLPRTVYYQGSADGDEVAVQAARKLGRICQGGTILWRTDLPSVCRTAGGELSLLLRSRTRAPGTGDDRLMALLGRGDARDGGCLRGESSPPAREAPQAPGPGHGGAVDRGRSKAGHIAGLQQPAQ